MFWASRGAWSGPMRQVEVPALPLRGADSRTPAQTVVHWLSTLPITTRRLDGRPAWLAVEGSSSPTGAHGARAVGSVLGDISSVSNRSVAHERVAISKSSVAPAWLQSVANWPVRS